MSPDKKNPNLVILENVSTQLGDLLTEVVFLGGCTTGLLITDPGAPSIRETLDVDVIVEIMTRREYYRFCDRLSERDFPRMPPKGHPSAVGRTEERSLTSCLWRKTCSVSPTVGTRTRSNAPGIFSFHLVGQFVA